jgi:PhzF family phenazine biosynthesis protein
MEILRYTAFSADPAGGNPAGVVLDASGMGESMMSATAADVGFSETAFVVPRDDGSLNVRYFSPRTEVPFCGHATIALAVAYAQRHGVGNLMLRTKAGSVPVSTSIAPDGSLMATLVSVPPSSVPIANDDLIAMLAALHWQISDLNPAFPPRAAHAGAWHPIIAARTRGRLADLSYDMEPLRDLMERNDWATVDLIWQKSPTVFHVRNPFPPGGVVEDPATGAAAAALGGYLREFKLIRTPATITIHQGHDMGRPGTIMVMVPSDPQSGIAVSGTAVRL